MSQYRIVIRPTRARIAYVVVFGGILCSIIAYVAVRTLLEGVRPIALIPIATLWVGGLMLASDLRKSVIVESQAVYVRNGFRVERFDRNEIRSFVEHPPNGPRAFGVRIVMLLQTGQRAPGSSRGPGHDPTHWTRDDSHQI